METSQNIRLFYTAKDIFGGRLEKSLLLLLSAELSIFWPTSFVFLYYLNYLQGISSIIKIRENGSIKETIYFP